jgi:GH15 family glucan-1,4-alpha-glucosidase
LDVTYYLETNNKTQAEFLIDWVTSRMLSSGTLSEQIDPDNQDFVSVAPLTWSQAEYVSTLLDMIGNDFNGTQKNTDASS